MIRKHSCYRCNYYGDLWIPNEATNTHVTCPKCGKTEDVAYLLNKGLKTEVTYQREAVPITTGVVVSEEFKLNSSFDVERYIKEQLVRGISDFIVRNMEELPCVFTKNDYPAIWDRSTEYGLRMMMIDERRYRELLSVERELREYKNRGLFYEEEGAIKKDFGGNK